MTVIIKMVFSVGDTISINSYSRILRVTNTLEPVNSILSGSNTFKD